MSFAACYKFVSEISTWFSWVGDTGPFSLV